MWRVARNRTILVLIGSLDRGGCETHLLRVLPILQRNGFDIYVQLLSHPGALAAEMSAAGVKVIGPMLVANAARSKSLLFRVARLMVSGAQFAVNLYRLKPDLVHFFLPASYVFGGPISFLKLGVRRVMSRRSLNHYMAHRPLIKMIEQTLHRKMDAVMGNSEAVIKQLIQDEGVPENKVHLVYNGVEIDKRVQVGSLNSPVFNVPCPAGIVISVVANLIPYKGHIDLLYALAKASLTAEVKWTLLLAGRDDGLGQEILRVSDELGIAQRVTLLGPCDDVSSLLLVSDIFVLPSHEEGFSNALLEAMIAGKAIVATDVGGNAEALNGGAAGLIVPPRDPDALCSALSRLLTDRELRVQLGSIAKVRAESVFTIDSCVAGYQKLYNSLLTR